MYFGNYRFEKPPKRKLNPFRVFILLLVVAAILISIIELLSYTIHSLQNQTTQKQLAEQYHHDEASVQLTPTPSSANNPDATANALVGEGVVATAPERASITPKPTQTFFSVIGLSSNAFQSIIRKNPDVVAWITIDGVVDQPVVEHDNQFYLTHDVNLHTNTCGAVFLDQNHPIHSDSQNLLLYGHNMKDETMFGRLHKYTEFPFFRNHLIITFSTRYQIFTYIIFAAARLPVEPKSANPLYFWANPTFRDEDEFISYVDDIQRHSIYTPFLDVDENDTLLTLATCTGDNSERLVLFARRQRTTDTAESIRTALLKLTKR